MPGSSRPTFSNKAYGAPHAHRTYPSTASDTLALAIDFFQSINFERVNALGDIIRAASTAQHFIAVVQEYAATAATLKS